MTTLAYNIKIPYQSLTETTGENYKPYNQYQLLKAQCDHVLAKPGFVSKTELQKLADNNLESKNTLVKKLNHLGTGGFITKSPWGYTLTSKNKIHNNLKFKTTKNAKGIENCPFKKLLIPKTNDVKVLDVSKLYLLIQQIFNQYRFRTNVNKSDSLKAKRPENFELSIDKIIV